jgi:hypothetical protein
VPSEVQDNVKVVGVLDGWPFEVKQDPTVADARALGGAGELLRLIQKVFAK